MAGFRIPGLPELPAEEMAADDLLVVFDTSAQETKRGSVAAMHALAATKANASAIGILPTADNMGAFSGVTIPDNATAKTALQALESSLDLLRTPGGAGEIGTGVAGETVADYLQYLRSDPFVVRWGYDSVTGTGAVVKMGSNSGLDGVTGVMQIGGAGPKDGGRGSFLANDGHPNWNTLQSSIPTNPTELDIYGNATGGVAVSNGTTTVTRATGSAWGPHMIGRTFWFDGAAYTVTAAGADTVTLNAAPPAGTKMWAYAVTTGMGTCSVVVGAVTRISGDPFIDHTLTSDTFEFALNGAPYTVTATNAPNSYMIASPPPDGNYNYTYRTNIANQIASLRLQVAAGASKENLTISAAPYGYVIGAQFRGSGQYRPLLLNSEGQAVVELAAMGKFVSLGGRQNAEALRAIYVANTINRLEVLGSPTGVAPTLRARGVDANVDLFLDVQGAGVLRFGTWAASADAAITGYITIKDAAGVLRKIATIA